MNEHGAQAERDAPVDPDARRWACATLGVTADAPADAVRAAFLKQVGEADFFPTPDAVVAWQTLAGAAPPASRAARIAQQRANDSLRAPVERFAERFFDLACAQRLQEWSDLRDRCQNSAALAARLEGLSAGLHIDRQAVLAEIGGPPPAKAELPAAPPSRERILAQRLFELFPLRPVDRGERQQEWMQAWQEELKDWQTASRLLKRRFSEVAALDAGLIDIILNSPKPARGFRRALARVTENDFSYENATHPPAKSRNAGLLWTLAVFLLLVWIPLFSRCNSEPRINSPGKQSQPRLSRRLEEMDRPLPEGLLTEAEAGKLREQRLKKWLDDAAAPAPRTLPHRQESPE